MVGESTGSGPRCGWLNERASIHVTAPYKESLLCEVLAWTPGTNGTVKSAVVQLLPPDNPTQEELTQYFASMKDKVAGKVVLVGRHVPTPVVINPPPKRQDDATAKSRYSANGAQGGPGGNGQPVADGLYRLEGVAADGVTVLPTTPSEVDVDMTAPAPVLRAPRRRAAHQL